MEVNVSFLGILAEVTQTTFKVYRDIKSIEELKLIVTDDFPQIAHYKFRISVNLKIVSNECVLNNCDEIAFLPPFEGG